MAKGRLAVKFWYRQWISKFKDLPRGWNDGVYIEVDVISFYKAMNNYYKKKD